MAAKTDPLVHMGTITGGEAREIYKDNPIILLPMFAGSLLLLGAGLSLRVKRSLSLVATLLLLPLSSTMTRME